MNKKHLILGTTIIAAAGTISVLNYTLAQADQPAMSDLTLANIECLGAPDKEIPTVKIPCKHTGNQEDICIYDMISTDGTIVQGRQWFCINDPEDY